MTEKVAKFTDGEYGEGYPWELVKDYEHQLFAGELPGPSASCPHAEFLGDRPQMYESQPHRPTYRVPRVIRAYNEGNNNSTILCLDCVLEATKEPS